MADLTTHSDIVPSARQEGDALILRVRGEVDLHSSPELRNSLLSLLQSTGAKKLILNLTDVPYMDSSAIAVMVEALQKLRKQGGKVCLTNLQPRVKGLLEIARLNSIFSVVPDEAAALKA
jgi:anti-sigma B factor antagonist